MNWIDPGEEDTAVFKVVVNHEEQYSLWPVFKEIPIGWKEVGKTGLKVECLAYIKDIWTDMRPLSLRKAIEERAEELPAASDPIILGGKNLVDRLCEGDHPVEAGLRPEKSAKLFKAAVNRNYVHIKFTGTEGGTELGVRLDSESCDFSQADYENGNGVVHVEGSLVLNYVTVKCVADIDLKTLAGKGRLVKV